MIAYQVKPSKITAQIVSEITDYEISEISSLLYKYKLKLKLTQTPGAVGY
jgi:hypothetical protein